MDPPDSDDEDIAPPPQRRRQPHQASTSARSSHSPSPLPSVEELLVARGVTLNGAAPPPPPMATGSGSAYVPAPFPMNLNGDDVGNAMFEEFVGEFVSIHNHLSLRGVTDYHFLLTVVQSQFDNNIDNERSFVDLTQESPPPAQPQPLINAGGSQEAGGSGPSSNANELNTTDPNALECVLCGDRVGRGDYIVRCGTDKCPAHYHYNELEQLSRHPSNIQAGPEAVKCSLCRGWMATPRWHVVAREAGHNDIYVLNPVEVELD